MDHEEAFLYVWGWTLKVERLCGFLQPAVGPLG